MSRLSSRPPSKMPATACRSRASRASTWCSSMDDPTRFCCRGLPRSGRQAAPQGDGALPCLGGEGGAVVAEPRTRRAYTTSSPRERRAGSPMRFEFATAAPHPVRRRPVRDVAPAAAANGPPRAAGDRRSPERAAPLAAPRSGRRWPACLRRCGRAHHRSGPRRRRLARGRALRRGDRHRRRQRHRCRQSPGRACSPIPAIRWTTWK